MPRSGLKDDREAQEVGAALIAAWFKLLPTAVTITQQSTTGSLVIEVSSEVFAANDQIAIANSKGVLLDVSTPAHPEFMPLSVRNPTPILNGSGNPTFRQRLEIFQNGNTTAVQSPPVADYVGGRAVPIRPIPASTRSAVEAELTKSLFDIVKIPVKVVADPPDKSLINVVLPRIPDRILSRQDLLQYLKDFHDYGEGQHYHEEFGKAVLFGCR